MNCENTTPTTPVTDSIIPNNERIPLFSIPDFGTQSLFMKIMVFSKIHKKSLLKWKKY